MTGRTVAQRAIRLREHYEEFLYDLGALPSLDESSPPHDVQVVMSILEDVVYALARIEPSTPAREVRRQIACIRDAQLSELECVVRAGPVPPFGVGRTWALRDEIGMDLECLLPQVQRRARGLPMRLPFPLNQLQFLREPTPCQLCNLPSVVAVPSAYGAQPRCEAHLAYRTTARALRRVARQLENRLESRLVLWPMPGLAEHVVCSDMLALHRYYRSRLRLATSYAPKRRYGRRERFAREDVLHIRWDTAQEGLPVLLQVAGTATCRVVLEALRQEVLRVQWAGVEEAPPEERRCLPA